MCAIAAAHTRHPIIEIQKLFEGTHFISIVLARPEVLINMLQRGPITLCSPFSWVDVACNLLILLLYLPASHYFTIKSQTSEVNP